MELDRILLRPGLAEGRNYASETYAVSRQTLANVVEWLFEECKEHPTESGDYTYRWACGDCLSALKTLAQENKP